MSAIVGICAASDPEAEEEEWALDTGAGLDVAGQGVAGEIKELLAPTPIWSAGGMIASSQVLKTQVAPLQQAVDATILAGSPNALAVGRRCAEQGFAFYWKPFAPVPELYLPSGERVAGVRADANYVPFVRNARPRGGPGKTTAMPAFAVGEPVGGPVAPADDDADGGPEPGAHDLSPVKVQDPSIDDAEDRSLLRGIQRVIDAADRTDHDAAADVIADASGFVARPADPGADDQEYRVTAPSPLNLGHMAMHLPRLKGCSICDDAKHLHRYHRRRADVLFCLTGEDATSSPFGALLHLDWIEIRRGSSAARSASRALVLTDDLTHFMGIFPSHAKDADTVVEFVHRFDETPPVVRRWWSDRAEEFLAASRRIRALRPLAHFTAVPWRHAPRAEHSNRVATEGARALLLQAGMPDAWWPLGVTFWTAMWNGFMTGQDGYTPYLRRHGVAAPYRQYPFGALVLFHPHKAVETTDDDGVIRHEKLQAKLVPAVLLEITLGPASIWGSCYGVIPLARFTSNKRPSRAALRRTTDVVFPEVPTFPLKQRLALHGAVADRSLPGPAIGDDG